MHYEGVTPSRSGAQSPSLTEEASDAQSSSQGALPRAGAIVEKIAEPVQFLISAATPPSLTAPHRGSPFFSCPRTSGAGP